MLTTLLSIHSSRSPRQVAALAIFLSALLILLLMVPAPLAAAPLLTAPDSAGALRPASTDSTLPFVAGLVLLAGLAIALYARRRIG